jgi:hypothetical protein
MSTIFKTLVPSLVGLTSSRAVWLALEKMFSSQSRARVMTTRYTLATLKKGSLTITDYFQKAKACADLLASIGEPISDSAITSYILAGLPHDYDSIIATVNTRVEAFPLDELYGHLLMHELHIDQQVLSSPDITTLTANFAAKSSQPSQNRGHQSSSQHGRTRGRGRGFTFSHGRGSTQFSSNNSGSSRAFCQIYFKAGHTAQACWHRFDQNFQVSSNHSPQAFAASTSSTVDPAWYPDTGANNHITADYGNLNLHADDYTGQDQVRISKAKVCTFITLVPLFFAPLTKISFLKIFYMCLTSVKTFFLSINLPKIIMFSLNFTRLFFVSRIYSRVSPFSAARVKTVSILSIPFNGSSNPLPYWGNVCPLNNGIQDLATLLSALFVKFSPLINFLSPQIRFFQFATLVNLAKVVVFPFLHLLLGLVFL